MGGHPAVPTNRATQQPCLKDITLVQTLAPLPHWGRGWGEGQPVKHDYPNGLSITCITTHRGNQKRLRIVRSRFVVAEEVGFEPTVLFAHAISSRAH